MTMFLVERYLADIAPDTLRSLPRRLETATAELRAQGTNIVYLDSTFLPEEESCFCRFDAPNVDAVKLANRIAEAPYSRITAAVMLASTR